MKPAKPERTFHVAIYDGEQKAEICAIYGESFFLARAAIAIADGVEPQEIRLDPPRRHS